MGEVRVRVRVRAPIEEVFKYLADGENAPEWHPSITSARRLAGTRLGPGSIVRYEARIGPLLLAWVTRAAEFKWNEYFRDVLLKVERGPLAEYELSGRFEAEGDSVLVEFHLKYKLTGGIIGTLVDKLLVERAVRRHMEEGLERARGIIEFRARG